MRPDFYAPNLASYAGPAPRREGLDAVVDFLFGARGRVSRGAFWLSRLGMVVAFLLIYALVLQSSRDLHDAMVAFNPNGYWYVMAELVTALIAFILVSWSSVVIAVKRWHDIDLSGWWMLLQFVPVIGWLALAVVCGFFPGTAGDNRFGPKPGVR